jgi:sugar phosphate isomerase/epimerase
MQQQMPMRFCIRRGIDFENSRRQLEQVRGVPIELALPSSLEIFLSDQHRLDDVERQIHEFDIPVRSVHAPHGQLGHGTFRKWAGRIIQFAEALDSEMLVFHPEERPEGARQDEQSSALLNIKYLQDRTAVMIAVETLWDKERVLTPDEIMEHRLPMVLDTSYIPKTEITWIIESYRTHLVNVHLSAVTPGGGRTAGRQFRPIDNDPFCLDILDRLHELGWEGVVTLEYLPWFSGKAIKDRKLLERIYGN